MAVEAGDAEAAALLGAVYELGPKTRDLYVPQDLAAAESLYERASADESGNAILLIEVSEKSSMKFKMIDSLPRQVATSA